MLLTKLSINAEQLTKETQFVNSFNWIPLIGSRECDIYIYIYIYISALCSSSKEIILLSLSFSSTLLILQSCNENA